MLYARRRGVRGPSYRIVADGRRLTTWTPLVKGAGGRFHLDGVDYLVDAGGTAPQAGLSTADGTPLAVAEGLGGTPWTVRTAHAVHTFQRAPHGGPEQLLVAGGRPVGLVRRAGRRGRDAEAQLPGLPAPVAVFVLAVVITMWTDRAAAGGTGRAAG